MNAEALTSIDAVSAAAYVHAHGWREVAANAFGTKWRHEADGRTRNIATPSGAIEADDHVAMLATTLRVLQEVEQRPADVIARRMADAARDVVRFRLVAPELSDGEMPLAVAPDLLAGSRDALKYAGRSAFRTSPHYPTSGTLPSDVNAFLDGARVGATERGSTILVVRCDVDDAAPNGQLSFLPESERSPAQVPFERRALRRLLAGVCAAKSAAKRDLTSADRESLFDQEMEDGLSANLCDALRQLSGNDTIEADVEVSVRWSLLVPANEPESQTSITAREIAPLAQVAQILREIAPVPNAVIFGNVKGVHHVADAPSGWADATTEHEGRPMTVRIRLDQDEVPIALTALRENATRDLRAAGTLEKHGRTWEMADARDLAVVETRRPKNE